MATTYNDNNPATEYFRNRPDVVKIFDDLDDYQAFCRTNFMKFDEATLYRRDSYEYRTYLASKKKTTSRRKK